MHEHLNLSSLSNQYIGQVTREGYILYVWWPFAHHLVAMMASGVTEHGEKEHNVNLVLQNTSQLNW